MKIDIVLQLIFQYLLGSPVPLQHIIFRQDSLPTLYSNCPITYLLRFLRPFNLVFTQSHFPKCTVHKMYSNWAIEKT